MKIDNIPQSDIESKNEQRWFSLIKFKAEELQYGELSFKLTIKNGKVIAVKNVVKESQFQIGLDN